MLQVFEGADSSIKTNKGDGKGAEKVSGQGIAIREEKQGTISRR
jgi:hypothetical protein